MVIGVSFLSYGPYHFARLDACQKQARLSIIPFSMSQHQKDYAWDNQVDSRLVVLEMERDFNAVTASDWMEKIDRCLDLHPVDVMAVAGYSHPSMLAMILACAKRGVPLIMMGDSQRSDSVRHTWREWFKRRIVRLASSALVAASHMWTIFATLAFRPLGSTRIRRG